MMRTIQTCFGWSGVLSTLAWVVAVVVCLALARHVRRERVFAVALGLALLGYALARWNAAWVGEIRLDRTDEIRAAQEAQQRLLIQEEQSRREAGESIVRFAEDAPGESVGSAVVTPAEVERQVEASAGEPAYRAAGKQKRSAGKVDAAAARLARTATAAGATAAEPESVVSLKLPDYQMAIRLSRINTLLAGLVLLGVLGVALGDYLRRFNHPREAYWPLPIGGVWMNTVSVWPLLARWKGALPGDLVRFLEQVTRKGETFVYVGDRVQAADLDTGRLRVGRRSFWRLPLLTWGGAAVPRDDDFLFDAVWFARYGVLVGAAEAGRVLPAFVARLADRAALRATVAGLPHLVCDLGPAVDPELLANLCLRCEQTGIRLVVVEAELPGRGIGPVVVLDAAVSH